MVIIDNLLMNIKISLISSVVIAGLTFFTEMRHKINYRNKKLEYTKPEAMQKSRSALP